ncbi:ArsC family reductase [Chryseolinea sp. T2]|uniref:ArsC family reductase n=1 Tax=Chryseolinea sp. T2 TaxID=3129255 RepID=UPI00307713B8
MLVYGIKNCNTVKNALTWLDEHKVAYEFHDYKKKGITADILKSWSKQVGWESLLNRKGLTWKQLPEVDRAKIKTEDDAIKLMIEKTSIIKRPLLEEKGKVILLGFDEDSYQNKLRK